MPGSAIVGAPRSGAVFLDVVVPACVGTNQEPQRLDPADPPCVPFDDRTKRFINLMHLYHLLHERNACMGTVTVTRVTVTAEAVTTGCGVGTRTRSQDPPRRGVELG